MTDITPDSMIALQLDDLSLHATSVLPRLLQGIESWNTDSIDVTTYREALKSWNGRYQADAGAGALFHRWWGYLHTMLWSDE